MITSTITPVVKNAFAESDAEFHRDEIEKLAREIFVRHLVDPRAYDLAHGNIVQWAFVEAEAFLAERDRRRAR